MRPLLLFIILSAVAAAGPPATPAPPRAVATQAPAKDKPATVKRRRMPHPLRCLRRIGQAEVDLAMRVSSWGIERDTPGR